MGTTTDLEGEDGVTTDLEGEDGCHGGGVDADGCVELRRSLRAVLRWDHLKRELGSVVVLVGQRDDDAGDTRAAPLDVSCKRHVTCHGYG